MNIPLIMLLNPEIDFPDGHNVYAPEIYKKGRDNFEKMKSDGVFKQDEKIAQIYSQTMNGRTHSGIVGCGASWMTT